MIYQNKFPISVSGNDFKIDKSTVHLEKIDINL